MPRIIATTRPTESGGTVTVNRKGGVTERDSEGRVVKRYKVSEKSASSYMSQVSKQRFREKELREHSQAQQRKSASRISKAKEEAMPSYVRESAIKSFSESPLVQEVRIEGYTFKRKDFRSFTPANATIEAAQPFDPDRERITGFQESNMYFERQESPMRAAVFQPISKGVNWLEEKSSKSKGLRPYTDVGVGAIAGVVGLTKAIAYPKKTYEGVKLLVKEPFTVGRMFKEHIHEKGLPFVVGEFTGYYYGGKVIGGAIKKSPVKLKYTKFEIPISKTQTKVLYRGLSVKVGRTGYNIFGLKGLKPTIGTPKLSFKVTEPFILETSSQAKILLKSKPYGKIEMTKFQKGLKIMKATETTSSKFLQKEFTTHGVKYLTPKQTEIVLKFAKQKKGYLYGSYSTKHQMPKDLQRIAKDIDIQFKVSELKTIDLTKQLYGKLKGKGYQVRISKSTPTLIEAKVKGQWHHALDIHSIDPSMDVLSPAYAKSSIYGLRLNQKPIKISGIKAMKLSEHGLRKGGSIYTMRPKGFAPEAHRVKDIQDFFTSQEALIRSKGFGKAGLMKDLTSLKQYFPKNVLGKSTTIKSLIYSPKVSSKLTSVPIVSPFISSPSISPSVSPSRSIYSVSPSRSVSRSPSKHYSKYYSPYSYISSPSISPSISPSSSPSPSPSPSPSASPSARSIPSYYYSVTPKEVMPPTTTVLKLPEFFRMPKKKAKGYTPKRKHKYQPSLVALALNIKGKKPKFMTGLGIRKILRS